MSGRAACRLPVADPSRASLSLPTTRGRSPSGRPWASLDEDFGWLINYSPSASRWFDGYFAVGLEWDYQVVNGGASTKRYAVTESGIKFRFDLTRTPLRFMRKRGTTFWGLRAGIQFRGVWSFDNIGYVFEFGAGSW